MRYVLEFDRSLMRGDMERVAVFLDKSGCGIEPSTTFEGKTTTWINADRGDLTRDFLRGMPYFDNLKRVQTAESYMAGIFAP